MPTIRDEVEHIRARHEAGYKRRDLEQAHIDIGTLLALVDAIDDAIETKVKESANGH